MSIITSPRRVEQPTAVQQGRAAVPWATVLTLATVLAFADGFWVTSLRGAVGAIERTQSPFVSWLRESTVVLPVYAFAVLGALMLARRWFGPVLRARTVVATGLLVVAAATLVGVTETVVSAVYDYRLQTSQLQMMDAMRALCSKSCLAERQHSTYVAHVQGVLLIGRWMVLTNLVLVAWIVAMWGGRVKLASTRSGTAATAAATPGRSNGVRDLRLLLVGALAASAAVHIAVVPEHLTEWGAAGMFFIVLSVWELAVAGMLLARLEERLMLLAAAAVSAGPLVVWLYSRTAGLPFGPEAGTPEAIGLPDLLACALELASLVVALVLLVAPAWARRRRPASAHATALVALALAAATLIGVAGVGLSNFDVFGVSVGASSDAHGHG